MDGPHAIMIPHTSDGRVLFAVPWHNHVVLGTTDTPIDETLEEPKPIEEEIDFILANAGQYMTKKPKRKDVKSVFAGLRPLAANQESDSETKEISRHHKINVSTSGLISILGGKWTTYRKMAEDAINTASVVAGLKEVKCSTQKRIIQKNNSKPTKSRAPPRWLAAPEHRVLRAGERLSIRERGARPQNNMFWL